MKHLRTGLILALLACTSIFFMGCVDEEETGGDQVTVTFDADGGAPTPAAVTIQKNSSLGSKYPVYPTKDGYICGGWYSGTTKYTRNTTIRTNITLKAHWTWIGDAVLVTFNDLTADGSPIEATTKLTLYFDDEIEGLTADDINLDSGDTGAAAGALTTTNSVGVYDLALLNITAGGDVTVTVTKDDYFIIDDTKTVEVFPVPSSGGAPVAVAFTNLTANGSTTATTNTLTLTFDRNISTLTVANITVTGATKGTLTPTGNGVYTLGVSGITANGTVTVTVANPSGYTITGSPRQVDVLFSNAIMFSGLTQNGSTTAATTQLTLTFSAVVPGLSTNDITLNAGTTGATKGVLSGTGPTYTLTVTNVTASGSVSVAVAKSSLTFPGTPRTVTVFPTPSRVTVGFDALRIPGTSKPTPNQTQGGRTNVTKVEPNPTYSYAALEYDLSAYAGKTVTITLSMDIWLTAEAKAVWQINTDGYPEVAGIFTNLDAGTWHNLNGSRTFVDLPASRTLYLSTGQLTTSNTIYIDKFTLTITTDDGTGGGGAGGSGGAVWSGDNAVRITIGASENLYDKIKAFEPAGKSLTWTSSAPAVASVNSNGIVTALTFTAGGTSNVSSAATGTATITATVTGSSAATDTQTFTVTTTMESLVDLENLTPMKDLFASHFLIGNITRGYDTSLDYSGTGTSARITNKWLNRHFNVLTAENVMKPDKLTNGRNASTGVISYTWTNPDNFVNAAYNSDFKILAHVLLWHNQTPQWHKDMARESKETALAAMRSYITAVVDRYKGKIWAWDVLNEIFPDGVSASANWRNVMRQTGDSQAPNPWYMAIGADFVYEGFKAARAADPGAILYYNDYNMDQPGKATMVRNMVRDVNNEWRNDPSYDNRLLIEGIGMQSHHNTNVTVAHIRASLNLFKPLGVRISISELDLLSTGYNEALEGTNRPIHSSVTNTLKLAAANHYRDYFRLFIEFNDIIERVTFWGLYDRGSWRSGGAPLPFEGSPADSTNPTGILAKPAYYKILESLN